MKGLKNKNKLENQYIIFWLTQAVSQLGSSLTEFALNIWAYKETGSAMTVSLLSFCAYLPYIVVSIWAGAFVDRHSKKKIMLICDSIAAAGSIAALLFYFTGTLKIGYLYGINLVIGTMNAFQSPASLVATGMIVPKDKIEKISGMNAFSAGVITVSTPMLAPFFLGIGGLELVFSLDLISFGIAFCTLAFVIHFKEQMSQHTKTKSIKESLGEGFIFLKKERAITYLMLSMAMMNFFSRLTYENILTPMLLARSHNNDLVLSVVTGIIGLGGIIGGLIVSVVKLPFGRTKTIFVGAALSFLCGDLLMGLGQNVGVWMVAGVAASLPIPMISAMQNSVLYEVIPQNLQGRVFAIRNTLQFFTIPIGILLGGYLADYIFEPMMTNAPKYLTFLVGTGKGSGMAVMFLCTGVLGSIVSLLCYLSPHVRALEKRKSS